VRLLHIGRAAKVWRLGQGLSVCLTAAAMRVPGPLGAYLCWHVLLSRSAVCLSRCSAARRCYGIPLRWHTHSRAQAAHIASTALHACCGCGLTYNCFRQFLEQCGGSRTAAVCGRFAARLVVRFCLRHNCVEALSIGRRCGGASREQWQHSPRHSDRLPACCPAVPCCFGGTWAALAT
jgi:hypothetical protein